MLVSEERVKKWYLRDSWVYKNFAYIYQNPLWNTRIPVGRSVCPYFWSAILSMILLRPFVASITLIIAPIMKFLGLGFVPLDRWIVRKVYKFFHGKDLPPNDSRLPPTGIGVLLTVMLSGLTFVLCRLTYKLAIAAKPYIMETPVLQWISGVIIAALVLLLTLGFHKLYNHLADNYSECKTRVYWYVWVVCSAISSMIFVPTETWSAIKGIACGLGRVFAAIWHGIVATLVWIAAGIADISVVIWNWLCEITPIVLGRLWDCIAFSPYGYFPWWSYLAAFGAFAVMADNLLTRLENRKKENNLRTQTPEQIRAANRCLWESDLARCLTTGDDHLNEVSDYLHERNIQIGSSLRWKVVDGQLSYAILRDAIKAYFKDTLDKLDQNPPTYDPAFWAKKGHNQCWCIEPKVAEMIKAKSFSFDENRFTGLVVTAYNNRKKEIDHAVKLLEEEAAIDRIIKENRRNSWSHRTCVAVTTAIGDGAQRCLASGWALLCFTGKSIAWFWNGVVVAFFSNAWTFICYMFVLAKAKKQKACPYMVFQDPQVTPNPAQAAPTTAK